MIRPRRQQQEQEQEQQGEHGVTVTASTTASTATSTIRVRGRNQSGSSKKLLNRLLIYGGGFATIFVVVSLASAASRTLLTRQPVAEEEIMLLERQPRGRGRHHSSSIGRLLGYKGGFGRQLPAKNFTKTLPASLCVSTTSTSTLNSNSTSDDAKCQIKLCNNTDTDTQPSHDYGYYGFLNRPHSIRNLPMMLGGEAKAGSGCAISHKYEFLYIHVLKSGGMTIKTFLKQALCQNSTKLPCLSGEEYLDVVSCRRALVQYGHYFVWSFVRNPYSRMYSSYAMALQYNHRKPKGHHKHKDRRADNGTISMTPPRTLPPFEFEQYVFAKEYTRGGGPGRGGGFGGAITTKRGREQRQLLERTRGNDYDQARKRRHGQRRRHRHGGFMMAEDEEDVVAYKPLTLQCHARKALTYMDAVHCQPQIYFLFNRQYCPVFDFLGRLEHLAIDLRKVLDIIQSTELDQQYQLWMKRSSKDDGDGTTTTSQFPKQNSTSYGSQQKRIQLNGNLQLAYQNDNIRQAVSKEYHMDFQLLGYDPQIVPN